MFFTGMTEVSMRECGKTICHMGREDLFMPMEMSMKATGWIIKHMEKVSSLITMAQAMRVIGLKINSKDMVLRCGLMEQSMRANIKTDLKTVKAGFPGKTVQFT